MAKAEDLKAEVGLSDPPVERFQSAPPHIPDHELLRRIGGGSYGEVWLARNIMGTFRAVKIVYRRNFQDERPYEREFSGIQKFEPLSRSHEGLVDVLQMGRNEEAGYFYYVMELADCALLGGTACRLQQAESPSAPDAAGPAPDRVNCLECCVRRGSEQYRPATVSTEIADHGRLPFDQCLSIGLAMSSALEHLHCHGLVHRDVKPSNIILVNGIPKLADIGLVTGTDATISFVGTEGFIPPEGPGTVQADIYGLGKVLYELSTGKDRHDFPEPATRLGEFADRAELLELDEVIQKACAADPRRRYRSAAQMQEDLLLVKTGKSVRDKHALERRLKIMTRAGAVAAVVLALGAVAYMLAVREVGVAEAAAKREAELREQAEQATLDTKAARREERKHRMQAEAQAKKAETEAGKSQQVAQFLKDMLKGVGPSVALGRDTKMLREILDKTADRVSKDLRDQTDVRAELETTVGDVYGAIGEYEKSEAMLRDALELRRTLRNGDSPELATSLDYLAVAVVRFTRKFLEAETLEREALAMRTRLFGEDHEDVADSLNTLGYILRLQNRQSEAESTHRRALAIHRKLPDKANLADSICDLGLLLVYAGKLDEGEPLLREALALWKKQGGEEPLAVATTLSELSYVLRLRGKLPEAETTAREGLAMQRRLFGNDHPHVASSGIPNLAMVLRLQGKLGEAEALYREQLVYVQQHHTNNPAKLSGIVEHLMDLLLAQHKYVEAEQLFNEVLPTDIQNQPASAALFRSRANSHARRGQWKEAAADMTKAVTLEPTNHVLYHALAPLLVAAGDEAGYGQYCRQILTRFGGASDPVIAQLMAKACLIQRCSAVDLNATDKLADIATKGDPAHPYFPWLQFAKGLNEYRHDRFGEAVAWMQKVLAPTVPQPVPVPCRDVDAWMVLAMGQYQLKQVAEARVALAKGVAIEQTKLAKLTDGDLGTTPGDWVTAQALMSEAKALILGGAETNGIIKSATAIASPSPSPGRP